MIIDDVLVDEKALAQEICDELGSWMLGEVGDQGLKDAIHDQYEPWHMMSAFNQGRLFQAVHDEIFG